MRWGLIGASNIAATQMIDAIRASGGEIASVLSGDNRRGQEFAARHGIAASTTDLERLLEGVDAVYISTTNEKHFPQAWAAECVPGGPSVACSTAAALEWDASLKNVVDPSGRAVQSVHNSAY